MKTFLVVDDSKIIRTIASRALKDMGFATIEASDGQTALDMCKKKLPDAVLLDWLLPLKDGIAFTKEFRALQGTEDIPVIFCSSKTEPEDIQQALDAGANEYIMKPFDSEILKLKINLTGLEQE
jgi:two-component system chemotaxis response regulator CheY